MTYCNSVFLCDFQQQNYCLAILCYPHTILRPHKKRTWCSRYVAVETIVCVRGPPHGSLTVRDLCLPIYLYCIYIDIYKYK